MARIVVVGSVNLDLVARVQRLPEPGETLAAHELRRVPGGKGANQALAARRLGAEVALIAAVGAIPPRTRPWPCCAPTGVDLSGVTAHAELPTGHALVTVDDDGETTIVIVAGANDVVAAGELGHADAVLTVLEVPDLAVAAAAARATGMFVLNAAPARPVAPEVLRPRRPGRRQPGRVRRSSRASTPRARWPSPSAGTGPSCGAAARWWPGPRRRPPRSSTARARATASPRRSPSPCSAVVSDEDALRYACAAGRWPSPGRAPSPPSRGPPSSSADAHRAGPAHTARNVREHGAVCASYNPCSIA